MKQLIIMVLALCLCVGVSVAQDVSFSPKAGINYYDISEDELSEFTLDGQSGFHLGLDLRIGNKVYFQPGLHYYSLNTDFEGKDIGDLAQQIEAGEVRSESLRLPLVIGTSFLQTERINFRAQAGVTGLFLVNLEDNALLETGNFRNFSGGATFGLGMDIGIITLDIIYDIGLTDTFEDSTNYEGRSNILSFSAGLLF
ncbi:MAG: porin family protein [Bacteroidota bacterium]